MIWIKKRQDTRPVPSIPLAAFRALILGSHQQIPEPCSTKFYYHGLSRVYQQLVYTSVHVHVGLIDLTDQRLH